MWCDPSGGLGGLALCVAASLFPLGVPTPVERAFPVDGATDYVDAHHDYPANDVFAACGTPVLAAVDGVVDELGRRDHWDPDTDLGRQRGGRFVSIRGDDGVRYYGSHLSGIRPGLATGDRVDAGDPVGRVGHSGSARSTPCHLHFGISAVCPGSDAWWVRRGVVNPYPFLRDWESGGNRPPSRAVGRWEAATGCPDRP